MNFVIPFQGRRPLRLLRKSGHLHLSGVMFQSEAQRLASSNATLASLAIAFENRNFGELYRSAIALNVEGQPELSVELTSANTQLISLDDSIPHFRHGYEPDVSAVLDFFVPNDGAFLDVGSNFGYFSMYLASRPGFSGTIDSFEPSSRGFNDLSTLIQGLQLSRHIRPHNIALGSYSGYIDLLMSDSDGLNTTIPGMAENLDQKVTAKKVEIRRLDDFRFDKVDVIKIDVEGAEANVIAGAQETLKAASPVIMFESWMFNRGNDQDDSAVFEQLAALGYTFYIPCWGRSDGQITAELMEDSDVSKMYLMSFEANQRKGLPSRFNVVALSPSSRQKYQVHAGA
jgi:FkbM family methyltransferase